MERFARSLAEQHQKDVDPARQGRREDRLLPRLRQNERILVATYDLITATRAPERPEVPAAEWLLDNFYLIEEQILTARRHLPKSYSQELPQFRQGPSAHLPRIYAAVLPLIAHVDGHVDGVGLNAYVAAYQTLQPLTLGELWAIPTMLRLALIENLRRVSLRVSAAHHDRQHAALWAGRMLRIVEEKPTDLILVMADMVRDNPSFSGAFLSELTRHLHGQSPYFAFANSWLEHRVSEQGMTVDQLVQAEGQAQAADQVSMGNSITSLRLLSTTDWESFVEGQSQVERILSQDPADVYRTMDFRTRDSYRHQVEAISRHCALSETDVATQAVALAAGNEVSERTAHVGYYLIDKGLPALEAAVGMPVPLSWRLGRGVLRHPLTCYLGTVLLIATGLTAAFMRMAMARGVPFDTLWWWLVPLVLCSAHAGVATVNWLVTALVPPRPLPRLDYHEGIPQSQRTVVVIPTMLASPSGVTDLLAALEVRYLSNQDPHLHFALLTDLADAASEVTATDDALLRLAREGIERLNATYGDGVFFLFHRPRRWNARDRVWMGHERKRGKLSDFNARLRGGARFAVEVGDTDVLVDVRYVITLDTDTQLPRGAAHEMVSAMAHPLNRPVFDSRERVVAGYTILQPRVGVTLPSSQRSTYARLFSGDAGIDPYTRVVSDVYQDLFGEGTFIGKGIYDVDAFERRCGDFPDNTILSHDLLESAYARSALLSDVILYEDCPAIYAADVSRRHRWMRGDWQIAGWLLPIVRLRNGAARNPISALSRWKILDNLRRSLVPVATLALLLMAWLWVTSLASVTTLFVLATIGVVPLATVLTALVRKPRELPLLSHLRTTAVALYMAGAQFLLLIVLLPYDASVSIDAIARTATRMLWTRRRLLEWKTSHEAERSARVDVFGVVRTMAVAPVLGVATAVYAGMVCPQSLVPAGPLLVGWIASPFIAWGLSRPLKVSPVRLEDGQWAFLGTLSRRTWRFFEDFVTAEENWLPPDNVQQNPGLVIASRTSPTNVGVALLANLAACDFGYVSVSQCIERVERTLTTLGRLDRYHGHFYNWYDTRTLAPLHPRYVSTVDSGNLAGHLLVLARGLLLLADEPVVGPAVLSGLQDTVRVLRAAAPARLTEAMGAVERQLQVHPTTLQGWHDTLNGLADAARSLAPVAGDDAEVTAWAGALLRMGVDHQEGLAAAVPWVGLTGAQEAVAGIPTWRQVAALKPAPDWPDGLRDAAAAGARHAAARIQDLQRLAQRCQELADMDFRFLFDRSRDLFAIGYHADDERLDSGYYDLLASEARLASYVCIASGQMGQEHWFALGRRVTTTSRGAALLSWAGTMFEYLMPLLVMPTYPNTLLDQTYRGVVQRQIEYGRQRGVPWGISESGYNVTDAHRNYQYRAFGVPGLALKRGLDEDLVIAPYATALALMVAPEAACRNLERLAADGQLGAWGLYEAVDYTPSRLPPGVKSVTLRQVMAHHAGMSLLALLYLLRDRPMQRRFEAEPMLRAAQQLLQEKVPPDLAAVYPHAAEARARDLDAVEEGTSRVFTDPGGAAPEVHLLSNGRYHVMITSAGGGYSRWGDVALTRWREDATQDALGSFCYVRDVQSGACWSTTWQPTVRSTRRYEAIFTQSRAEFRRRDENIDTHVEISISPEDDIEVRRVTLVNHADHTRELELTTYSEVVLAPLDQDLSHRAFSNLFVETELISERQAIFCTRRPRSAPEHPPWLMHLMTVSVADCDPVSFETSRARFVGRGRTLARPQALDRAGRLSDTQGATLDPVACIRQVLRLKAGETVRVDLISGAAPTREALVNLMDKYHDPRLADRVFELAWTHSQIVLQQLSASQVEAQCYGRLASSVVYASGLRRAPASVLLRNRRGQSALWGYGISGDLPIVLVRVRQRAGLELVRQAVQAHAWWRLKGVAVDLVIWNEDTSGYLQALQHSLVDLVASSPGAALVDQPGGIFLRKAEQTSAEDGVLLQTVARVVLQDDAGTLQEQVERRGVDVAMPALKPTRPRAEPQVEVEVPRRDVALFNGYGGFSHDGREYVMMLAASRPTPAPWVNVLAGPAFGTVVSESGSAYTWAGNSHEFRLTPWHNDPVTDDSGEALYLRDEETGRFWSPTPLPAPGPMTYVSRHGFGYSVFEYQDDGISSELWIFVALDAPVKFTRLKLTNRSGRPRHLSATGYWEWVLGEMRHRSLMHVVTEIDPYSSALLARNRYSAEFGEQIAFVACSESRRSFTGDRTEFIGRNGRLAHPQAMRRARLSGRVGAGLDPAAALQVHVDLEEGQEREVLFILGAGGSEEEVRTLVDRYQTLDGARRALDGVWRYWSRVLGAVHVETPDVAFNFLANGWLVYQVLACRMWARTGFYQSGGAYGFRDQLQDAMALVHAEPLLLRDHLLQAASRQFSEGDVQHWWHPPVGRGVRTHCSDDFLWLAFATCRYVRSTGDTGVLDERRPYLKGRAVREDEEGYYDLPQVADEDGTLYDHCVRAIRHGLRMGAHGLPLMGSGDWNDGMNRVGVEGKGESVWLGFFLYDVLQQFADLARQRIDTATAHAFGMEADRLRHALNDQAWDGNWYLRAWFDDGTPLGSGQNEECQIDALPQSWSVLSGAGTPERSTAAMATVSRRLVSGADHLIRLFTPPFDRTAADPGYIKGYPPGIRENGGQYTHAAVWTVMACASLASQSGDGTAAAEAWKLCSLLNPATLSRTPQSVSVYRVEPYVMAADVYSTAPHAGHGGWTWYTGSAGWMYRLMTESLLGLRLEVDRLTFAPCPQAAWASFKVHFRYRETFYHVTVSRGTPEVVVDGNVQADGIVHLLDDRRDHQVTVAY